MSQQLTSDPALDMAVAFNPHEVQHLWMPSRRSLCELAVQRPMTAEMAAEHNADSQRLPVCGACVSLTEVLQRRVEALKKMSRGRVMPDPFAATELLHDTTWAWAISALLD